ncbi:hypothetical protein Tco_0138230 [Tanacetum coccineum]
MVEEATVTIDDILESSHVSWAEEAVAMLRTSRAKFQAKLDMEFSLVQGTRAVIVTPGQLKIRARSNRQRAGDVISTNVLFVYNNWLKMHRFKQVIHSSTSDIHLPVQHQEIAEEPIQEDTLIIHDFLHPSHNLVTGDPGLAQSSSGNVNAAEPNQVNYPPDHLRRDQRSSSG